MRLDLDLATRIERLEAAWAELGYEVIESALDEGPAGIHRQHEREGCDHASARATGNDRGASVASSSIVPAGSSSSALGEGESIGVWGRDSRPGVDLGSQSSPSPSAFPRENRGEDGTMDEDEVRQGAETELGRSLQDIRRLVSEAQAEIETVREAVGELVRALEKHVADHERDRRSWLSRFSSWLGEGAASDRRPW